MQDASKHKQDRQRRRVRKIEERAGNISKRMKDKKRPKKKKEQKAVRMEALPLPDAPPPAKTGDTAIVPADYQDPLEDLTDLMRDIRTMLKSLMKSILVYDREEKRFKASMFDGEDVTKGALLIRLMDTARKTIADLQKHREEILRQEIDLEDMKARSSIDKLLQFLTLITAEDLIPWAVRYIERGPDIIPEFFEENTIELTIMSKLGHEGENVVSEK